MDARSAGSNEVRSHVRQGATATRKRVQREANSSSREEASDSLTSAEPDSLERLRKTVEDLTDYIR
jgi:hypothetical protein